MTAYRSDKSSWSARACSARIVALALAMALAVSAFALSGCSSASNSGSASSVSSSAASSAAASVVSGDRVLSSSADDAADNAIGNSISVSVSVASSSEDDGFEAIASEVELEQNATALDALEAVSSDVVVSDGQYGAFVESINGLANGSAGAQSGWTYTVNGEYATVSAGEYTLSDGDSVEWLFYV